MIPWWTLPIVGVVCIIVTWGVVCMLTLSACVDCMADMHRRREELYRGKTEHEGENR